MDSLWELDAVARGAGPVVRNTAASIMILPQVRSYLERRIIMMADAVGARGDLKKTTIAQGVIVVIVENVGRGGRAGLGDRGGGS